MTVGRYNAGDPYSGIYPGQMRVGFFPTPTDRALSPLAMGVASLSATKDTPPPTTDASPSSAKDAAQKHELTDAERLDQFGSALQEIGQGLAPLNRPQDAAALEAMQRQLQQQRDTFEQQARFGQTPAPYRLVAPVTLNMPAVATARPGDRAIGALASLYR